MPATDLRRSRIPLDHTAPLSRSGSIDLPFVENLWDDVGRRHLDVACHYETHRVRQVKTTVREYRRSIDRLRYAMKFVLEQEFLQQESLR